MPTLRRTKKPADATGKALDPAALYTPLSSHGRVVNGAPRVYNPGVELRGDHEAVVAAPHLWVTLDVSADEKLALRRARSAASLADLPPRPEDVHRIHIGEARKIPLERLVVADQTFWKGNLNAAKGSRHDIDDPIVQRAPEMFRRADGSPLPKEAA